MTKRHWNRVGDLESLFLHLEELVVANSGEDEFEEVFKLLLAKLWDERSGRERRFYSWPSESDTVHVVSNLLREAKNNWPGILDGEVMPRLQPEHLQVCVNALARHSIAGSDCSVLDGLFEHLVSKGAKGAKGQFFTPRYIIDFCVRALRPRENETVCDPACGSGGFLLHALQYVRAHDELSGADVPGYCSNRLWGFDIDVRATRVAKALMLVAGDAQANIVRLNSLLKPDMGGLFSIASHNSSDEHNGGGVLTVEDVCRSRMRRHSGFDLILTNPPFAGEVRERHILDGYKASRRRPRSERDVLFLERCIGLLRPGGRLAIILPHNKFAGIAFRQMRQSVLEEAQVLGVIGLGRNTFLPHTHQKTNVLFLRRRQEHETKDPQERIFFAVSERDGKDSKGRVLLRTGQTAADTAWTSVDHDLEGILEAFRTHGDSQTERKAENKHLVCSAKRAADLGPDLVLAPERFDPRRSPIVRTSGTRRLGDMVESVRLTVNPRSRVDNARFLVLDTSDAREGIVMCRRKAVTIDGVGSTKKCVTDGCILVSRLRPYLRQVAFVDREIPGWSNGVQVLCSTEFFVLRSGDSEPIGFLVPFLLSGPVQRVLGAAQEGGHHPRFDQKTLLDLPVPNVWISDREKHSARVQEAVSRFRQYEQITGELVEYAGNAFG